MAMFLNKPAAGQGVAAHLPMQGDVDIDVDFKIDVERIS